MIPLPQMAAVKALPWRLIGWCAAAMLFASLIVALKMERAQSAKFRAQVEKCADAREADRRAYEQAQITAREKNKAEVQRIEKEQSDVTRQVTSDLNSRLERLRRELRQKASPAGSPPHGPGAGADGRPRPGTDEEAGLCLAPDELLRAAENEERHDRLIDWVEQQLKIRR